MLGEILRHEIGETGEARALGLDQVHQFGEVGREHCRLRRRVGARRHDRAAAEVACLVACGRAHDGRPAHARDASAQGGGHFARWLAAGLPHPASAS